MRALALGLTAALSIAACAQADEQATYSVFGVAESDTLALRASPNATAAKVGDIPASGTGIRVLRAAGPNSPWVEVDFNGKQGWVNGRYLGYGAPGSMQLPATLQCSGTEPFWGITLTPGTLDADLNFIEKRYQQKVSRAAAAMNRNDVWLVKARDGTAESNVIIRKEVCSDGMSDREYPYSAVALVPGSDIIAGCCAVPAQ